MPKPITKIIISLPSPDSLEDVWKVFDYIILKMEELDRDGMPKVDALGRKKFRAEVMRVSEGKMVEVFSKWVTLLVPEFVPVNPDLLKQPPVSAETQALIQKGQEAEEEERRKAELAERRREQMARARAARKPTTPKGKSHHKKPAGRE